MSKRKPARSAKTRSASKVRSKTALRESRNGSHPAPELNSAALWPLQTASRV